jgi:hypothetical protein
MTKEVASHQIQSISCDPAISTDFEPSWESAYWSGRKILEAVRLNAYANAGGCGQAFHLLTGNNCLRELIQKETESYRTDFESCHEDVQLANAVDRMVEEHGIAAQETLFVDDPVQSRKAVMQISRKSRERQYERLHSVWIGDSMTVAPNRLDQAPDTMTFAKLFSRVGRARGSVDAGLRSLRKKLTRLSKKQAVDAMDSLIGYEFELRT